VRLVPLRAGTKPIGLLAAAGRPVEAGTLDTLAGLVAIAIERTQFLEERKSADLMRQSEELKTALLAALGHDLRTPLTAIRLAAANLTGTALSDAERADQRDVIVTEVARLTRLFDNVLQMARIDTGAVAKAPRATHPSEIVAAARDQVERGLRGHVVTLDVAPDLAVQVDPRLTATAVAHLLENAAQYSPPGARIDVTAGATAEGLRLSVRDHGPGVRAKDLPHVFERFYRGEAGDARPAGSGLGLWIARGLIAAQDGRIWVESPDDGGAQFTIVVPAAIVSVRNAAVRNDTTSPNPVG
jgi:two-component system sensor histidine kinase KdpD